MKPLNDPLETALIHAYAEQAQCYRRILPLAERLNAAFQDGSGSEQLLREMAGVFDEVARIEQQVADAKVQFKSASRTPGPELAAVLDQVAKLIEQVTRVIGQAELAATVQQNRLHPQLDSALRGRQMQRAYQQTMTAHAE